LHRGAAKPSDVESPNPHILIAQCLVLRRHFLPHTGLSYSEILVYQIRVLPFDGKRMDGSRKG